MISSRHVGFGIWFILILMIVVYALIWNHPDLVMFAWGLLTGSIMSLVLASLPAEGE